MPEKRPREEDEESDEASSAVASESDEDIAAELKKTVVIGNLEGRLEIIYNEVLAKKFPGAKGIVVDWKTKTAMVEYESEEQAAAVVGKVNNEPLFGEPLRCGVSSGATTELLFSNLPVRATGEDVANMIRRGGAEAPAQKRRRKSGAEAGEGGAAEDTSGLLHVKHVVGGDGTCKCYCKFSDRSFSDAALKVCSLQMLAGKNKNRKGKKKNRMPQEEEENCKSVGTFDLSIYSPPTHTHTHRCSMVTHSLALGSQSSSLLRWYARTLLQVAH